MSQTTVEWPEGAAIALSIVVNVEEGSEYSVAEGDRGPDPVDELGVVPGKPIRNYGNESNYAYGIKAGAPRVLAPTSSAFANLPPLELSGRSAARISWTRR